jgi:hypothetical protein
MVFPKFSFYFSTPDNEILPNVISATLPLEISKEYQRCSTHAEGTF